jgi:2-polyprenyl-3-methyl-5-hydroxy-6-metoxy-1,4-benzoquinol methylase
MSKSQCKICDSTVSSITVCNAPISGIKYKNLEESLNSPFVDHILMHCNNCNMVSYKYFNIASELLSDMYKSQASTYSLLSGASDYTKSLCRKLVKKYNIKRDDSILEIGCNDGELLNEIRAQAKCKVRGIEPSGQFEKIWKTRNLEIINDFLSDNIIEKISGTDFRIIIFRHVFEHILDPKHFFSIVHKLSNKNSIIIIEVPYLDTIIKNKRYENISYSHLNYFSLRPLKNLAKQFGYKLIHFEKADTDGGSIVVHLSRQEKEIDIANNKEFSLFDLTLFIKNIRYTKSKIHQKLNSFSKSEIVAYGAGAKGPHLLYLFELQKYISAVIDDNLDFENKYIAGSDILIKTPEYLKDHSIKAVVNFAPTHRELIKSKVDPKLEFIDLI